MSRDRRGNLLDWIMKSDSFAAALELLDQVAARKIEAMSKAQAEIRAAKIHVDAIDAEYVDLPAQDGHGDPDVPRKSGSIVAIPSTRARGGVSQCPVCGKMIARRGRTQHVAKAHPTSEIVEWST